ncbi:MAG TPA: hypothetical protein VHM28_04480 [Anaerolineales bacterium]|jgi:hypothetical protein|nr:hypothetical protein [Anaerolineales bacterium]
MDKPRFEALGVQFNDSTHKPYFKKDITPEERSAILYMSILILFPNEIGEKTGGNRR